MPSRNLVLIRACDKNKENETPGNDGGTLIRMDFEVPVCKNYATESQKICWVSSIYNQECIEVFLMQCIFSKVVFVRNVYGHVVKMPFGAGTRRYVAVLA